jgi:hypothetical protein
MYCGVDEALTESSRSVGDVTECTNTKVLKTVGQILSKELLCLFSACSWMCDGVPNGVIQLLGAPAIDHEVPGWTVWMTSKSLPCLFHSNLKCTAVD